MKILCVVITTIDKLELARELASDCVKKKLAACVNITPNIESIYAWQGDVISEGEVRLVFKTSLKHREALLKHIVSKHPYETPMILCAEMECNTAYFDYLTD